MVFNMGEIFITGGEKIVCDGTSVDWNYDNVSNPDHVTGKLHVGDLEADAMRLMFYKITDQVDIWIIMFNEHDKILYRKISDVKFIGESGSYNTYQLTYDSYLNFKAKTISNVLEMSKDAFELLLKRLGEL